VALVIDDGFPVIIRC
ncbi:jg15711, partial [Pararge aegeria aegeria]